jgi:hypothetical protein
LGGAAVDDPAGGSVVVDGDPPAAPEIDGTSGFAALSVPSWHPATSIATATPPQISATRLILFRSMVFRLQPWPRTSGRLH